MRYDDSVGRAFVIHDFEGSRVTAALIDKDEAKAYIPNVGVYPTWTGTPISGSVTLGWVDDTLSIGYDLTNADPSCSSAGSSANSCGIHIHSVNNFFHISELSPDFSNFSSAKIGHISCEIFPLPKIYFLASYVSKVEFPATV